MTRIFDTDPDSTPAAEDAPPQIRRIRHELRRRSLTVADTVQLSPHMIRLTLTGADLADFVSLGADDHLKVILPQAGPEEARRDYTPRRFDPALHELVLDFVDHPGGPAADFARELRVGDSVTVAGPRGSAVVEGDIAHWLLIGDETALPAIGRRIEDLPAGTAVTSLVAVPGTADEQALSTAADWRGIWVHRPLSAAADPGPLLAALAGIDLPARCYVWLAAEAGVARALRDALLTRGHPKTWMKASGYWTAGRADASEKTLEG